MGYNPRLSPDAVGAYVPSIASAGSLIAPLLMASAAGEVVGLTLITGGATLSTNWSLNVYKNASATGSRIHTTGSLAALGSYTGSRFTPNGAAANLRFAADDIILYELVSQGGTTTNSIVQLDTIYARATGATPAAGTGPA